ncbi:hypothetical protein SDC9_145187 [bioreactor metagenome]|uniref:Uncharacterized protein n=1 Tax=bioreactor metagenome TaxID=1076179 RepID=A0A645E8T1_9ZZZZ
MVEQQFPGNGNIRERAEVERQKRLLDPVCDKGGAGGVVLFHGFADKVGDACAEYRQRQAGHILIGFQGDGHEGVDGSPGHAGQEGKEQRGGRVSGYKAAKEAHDSPQVHHSLYTQVEIACFFDQYFAQRAI